MVTYSDIDTQAVGHRNAAAKSLLLGVENAVYLLIILFFSGAIVGLMTDTSALDQENPAARLLWYPVYALVALLSLRCLPGTVRMAAFSPIIITCVLWCGLSMLWSVDPPVTMRRSIALLITTYFGLVLAARYDWNELAQRLAFAFLILALITVGTALLMPDRGIMSEIHVGAWRGPWVEKNYLGGQMSRGLIIAMCAFAMRPDRGWIWVPTGMLCFAMVLMSTSKTALLICILSIGLFLALRIFRRFPVLRVLLIYFSVATIVVFVTLMLTIPDEMFELIGKERTLTGRTDIWNGLIMSIKEKPWLGFGYGVYWGDPLGPSYYVRLQLEWGVPSAHNGWIETWLSVGAVGVGLFILQYIITAVLAIKRVRMGGVEAYWTVLIVVMFLMVSMSESSILQQNDLGWIIFVATAAKLFAFERPYWRDPGEH